MHLRSFVLVFSCCLFTLGVDAQADDHCSSDRLTYHPYPFVPPFGYASQNPGSPKYFVPGYGYRIPGFGFSAGYAETLNSYRDFYEFGQRKHQPYDDTQHQFWSNHNGGPWYYPGWPANVRTRW